MDDIATWLTAQINDDERVALKAKAMRYDLPTDAPWERERIIADQIGGTSKAVAVHRIVAIFANPNRVLAEIDAKRQRIAWLMAQQHDMPEGFPTYDSCRLLAQPGELGDLEVGYCSCGLDGWRTQLLRFEALPYEDRADYPPEWRPKPVS
ncbi:DUF6221 family protein [Paractinoplanes toevensis]|uniref:DUF6221 family protein n=1 Tax=Paractinoplanes toevensis TaxID=571911 RepID=UPI001BB4275F|nr:DUF6221 family protein [Actinoplanes toevensis]